MNSAQIEIQLIASLVAIACAIPGTFLVLRKMAMISDAISHSILPGIVVGFFITQDLNSPLLIVLAALTGVITVVLVEYIQKTGLVKEDTAIGLVFPALFSIGVILVVALMIAPAATAYLLTTNLKKMLALAVFFGVFSAISGYWLAHLLDASIAGSITTMLGLLFLAVYLFAPSKGVIAVMYREKQQRTEVSLLTFLLHLKNHNEVEERHVNHLREHINWQKVRAKTVLELALKNNMIIVNNDIVSLTKKGDTFTSKAIDYIITNKDAQIEDMKDDFFLFRG